MRICGHPFAEPEAIPIFLGFLKRHVLRSVALYDTALPLPVR